jgi:hypothetical protein
VLSSSTLVSDYVFLSSEANSSGSASITLPTGGVCVTARNSSIFSSGQLVTAVYISAGSGIQPSLVSYVPASGELDLAARTVGSDKLSPYCKFYEAHSSGGFITQLSSTSLLPGRIPKEKILHAGKDGTGKITHIVLSNQIYDCYTYGELSYTRNLPYSSDALSCGVRSYNCQSALPNPPSGGIGGISGKLDAHGNAILADFVLCKKYTGIPRYAFDSGFVTVDSKRIPIAPGVSAVVRSTGETLSLSEAIVYSSTFEVYTDPGDFSVRYITVP